jgi:hypothetical protein
MIDGRTCEEELALVRNLYDELFDEMKLIKSNARKSFRSIMDELGVPQDGYPQTVTNAYEIAEKASAELA